MLVKCFVGHPLDTMHTCNVELAVFLLIVLLTVCLSDCSNFLGRRVKEFSEVFNISLLAAVV